MDMKTSYFDEFVVSETLIQMGKYGITSWEFEVLLSEGGAKVIGQYFIDLIKNEGVPSLDWTALREFYKSVIHDPKLQFNKVSFIISADGVYTASYVWDEKVVKDQIAQSAYVMPQWINRHILSLLNEAGYPDEESYWQHGVFTFSVVKNELKSNIVLYNSDKAIPAAITIPNYIKDGILEHYKITHEGLLKNDWEPWNQLEIRCPHNDIYLEKDVTYRFIE